MREEQPKMTDRKVKLRSIIKKYFPDELLLEIYKVSLCDFSNNKKGKYIKNLLTEYNVPWDGLGPGTNRMAVKIEEYAVKIALDKDGMIDSKREMIYTKELQPYVIKVYECLMNGLVMVCEYVEIFTLNELYTYKEEIQKILGELSKDYLIGDVGVTKKNYVNWGIKADGQICMLDYAYIYATGYNTFRCHCSFDAILEYDANFVKLICPNCGKSYEFREVRRRISRKAQDDEIGDIATVGYVISNPEEEVPRIAEFDPHVERKKKKKLSAEELDFKRAYHMYQLEEAFDSGEISHDEYEQELKAIQDRYKEDDTPEAIEV